MLGYFLADRPNSIRVELGLADHANAEAPVADPPSRHPPVSVFLLGDDPIMEADLCEHLWSHPDFELIAVHYDVRSAMRIANALEPDIILVHVGREDTDRLSFIQTVRAQYPDVLILVSFSKAGLHLRKQALAAGANGELADIEDATLGHAVLAGTIEHFAERATDAMRKPPSRRRTTLISRIRWRARLRAAR